MTKVYIPRSHSLAHKLCAFFFANDDEQLSTEDIELKYGVEKRNMPQQLRDAVEAELLTCRGRVYSAGARLAADWTTLTAPPQPGSKPPRARAMRDLPRLDLATLAVRNDVPLPETGRRAAGAVYEALFAKLTRAGQSILFPAEYHGTVMHAATRYKRNTGVKLSIRKLDETTSGVWRIE